MTLTNYIRGLAVVALSLGSPSRADTKSLDATIAGTEMLPPQIMRVYSESVPRPPHLGGGVEEYDVFEIKGQNGDLLNLGSAYRLEFNDTSLLDSDNWVSFGLPVTAHSPSLGGITIKVPTAQYSKSGANQKYVRVAETRE